MNNRNNDEKKAKPDISNMTTLCYIQKDEQYLMLHRTKKKKDANQDKWIGIGGHFKEGESPEECLLREVAEETGLGLTSFQYRGIVTFVSDTYPSEYMHLFTADAYTGSVTNEDGTMKECEEGVMQWVAFDQIPNLSLWEGDKVFLRLLQKRRDFFSLKLTYCGEKLVDVRLDGRVIEISWCKIMEALCWIPL